MKYIYTLVTTVWMLMVDKQMYSDHIGWLKKHRSSAPNLNETAGIAIIRMK
jgi:hypothetical protein